MNTLPYNKQVNPVENDEPYFIGREEEEGTYTIYKEGDERMAPHTTYHYTNAHCEAIMTREEALIRAEAQCARLNAEYRKEQENG